MKKICLLLVMAAIAVSCNKEAADLYLEKPGPNDLTAEEAVVLTNYLKGDAVKQSEAISEAESIMSFFDQNLATTRSVARRIGNVLIAVNEKPATRAMGKAEVDTIAYIVNFADDMGYAVISADRRTESIWAISDTGNIDLENEDSSSGLDVFFANAETAYNQQILYAEENNNKLLNEALAKMNKADDISTRAIRLSIRTGNWEVETRFGPLVKVQWGQRSPYNDNAPIINGKRALAGCTATAIAQVMSYHRYPTYYNWTEVNKYSWPSSTVAKSEVAKIFRTIGDNVKMNWGTESSGAWVYNAPTHFRRMGYKKTGNYAGYNFQRIIHSTMNGTPVIMVGYSIKETYSHRHWFLGKKHTHTRYKDGHSWVIDGYINRKRKIELRNGSTTIFSYYQYEQLLHCNYGWNGIDDGYYNSAAFDTNKGPVTRSGEPNNYQFKLETLYDVSPY